MRTVVSVVLFLVLVPAASAQELEDVIDQAIAEVCLAAGSDISDPFAAIDQSLAQFTAVMAGYSQKNCEAGCKQLGKFCSSYIKKSIAQCINSVLSFVGGFSGVACKEEAGPFYRECKNEVNEIVKGEKLTWKASSRFAMAICSNAQMQCAATCQ